MFLLLCLVPFHVQLVTGCDKLHQLHFSKFFIGVFTKILCVSKTVIRLYQVAHQCRQFHAPMPKSKRNKQELNQRSIETAPPTDEYTTGFQIRPTLVLDEYSPLLAPLTTEESTSKTVLQPPKPTEDRASDSETPIQQVTPLLGTTPRENLQLQHRNSPDDISNVLETHIYQGYVETPLQTLDGIVVNQPKRFLPLAEEAKCLTKEIRIKKLNEQWASIPCEQLLNQSVTDQLNSIQLLEQLAPLQLAKEHLPADIIDILEWLGKVDDIPFNQLYYIAENCVDQYYTRVIETLVSIIKRQFTDHQLLLVNTHSLKFLEEYADRQSQIWKIFQKHQTILEDLLDLHFHFDDFKNSIAKDFKFLKETTSRNIKNFQTSLNLQQTYSSPLCLHVNNIYSKLSELQRQIQNHHMHMNQGDTIQIEAPEFNPDIDGVFSPSTDEIPNKLLIQGTSSPTPAITEPENKCPTPATSVKQSTSQDTDWPDAIPVQIPSSIDQSEDQGLDRYKAQHNSERVEIPNLEENSEEEQFSDLDSYLAHHNTYEASQYIHQDYRSCLHALDDDQYYAEIDRTYYSHETLAAQDYQQANQAPGPCRTTEELMRIFRKGRGQARREELHGHRPFGPRTHSLQSHIQHKIKKNQRLCQRYTNNH